MAEIPKLDGDYGSLTQVEFREMGIQKIGISDQDKGSPRTTEMPESFIVDVENLTHGTLKDISANSRISVKLQRNLSKKGSFRGERNKTSLPSGGVTDGSSNGKASAALIAGGYDSDKSPLSPLCVGMKESINKQAHQNITITAESRCSIGKRYLKQRTSFIDPRRVLLFFATLSSMGTMVLIYFSLSINKFSGDSSTQSQ